MRRNLVAVPVVVLLAVSAIGVAAVFASDTPAAAPAVGERMGVKMTIQKASGEPGAYVCQTTVVDLAANKVLAEPSLQFKMGENAKSTTRDEGYSVEVAVVVSNGGEQVDHVVELRRGGVVTARQATTVHFPL
jgi:hypothetical protein